MRLTKKKKKELTGQLDELNELEKYYEPAPEEQQQENERTDDEEQTQKSATPIEKMAEALLVLKELDSNRMSTRASLDEWRRGRETNLQTQTANSFIKFLNMITGKNRKIAQEERELTEKAEHAEKQYMETYEQYFGKGGIITKSINAKDFYRILAIFDMHNNFEFGIGQLSTSRMPEEFGPLGISETVGGFYNFEREPSTTEEFAAELQEAFYHKKGVYQRKKDSVEKRLIDEDNELGVIKETLSQEAQTVLDKHTVGKALLRNLKAFKGLNEEKPNVGIDPFVATLVLEACMQLKGIEKTEQAKALAVEFGLDMNAIYGLADRRVVDIEKDVETEINFIIARNRIAAGIEPGD